MPTEVDICNMALSHIAQYPIQSLNDSLKTAQECKTLYPRARDSVLEDFMWNFAFKWIAIPLLDLEHDKWTYLYQYPSDCVRALEIYNSASETDKIEFEIYVNEDLDSKMIGTDQEDAVLKYTARVTNPNLFTSQFIDALSYRLAADLALPLRGDPKIFDAMLRIYSAYISRAQMHNANEREKTPSDDNSLVDARD